MEYSGKTVYKGVAIGRIRVYSRQEQQVKRIHIENVAAELARYEAARETAQQELAVIYEKACREVGEENAAVFEVHQMLLEDEDYCDAIRNIIETQSVNAEYAVAESSQNFAEMFASMEDEYMQARAADVKDISERLIRVLAGGAQPETGGGGKDSYILLAEDLAPSETVQMDKNKILAFVTVHGSLNSHTAILARTMNIPALVSVPVSEPLEAFEGKLAVVDGFTGAFYIEPEQALMQELEKRQREYIRQQELLLELKGKETVTKGGRRIKLYANVGNVGDIALALENDAAGVGLFRSEFIYLGARDYPSENEQFAIYKKALQLMAGKRLIVRTCDIGADKQADYFDLGNEENPAMGYRAIRICLDRPDFFKTQLRALFRASVHGKLSIMYPMIMSVEEIRRIRQIADEVCGHLKADGIPYKEVEQGIMIETPAAALMSDVLAREVDFFSIGTNDLTQYTLAVDRQNTKLEQICGGIYSDTHNPAVLRLIEMTVRNAHEAGIWCGICGEMGADLELTEHFLQMGIDELSVSPGMILPLRQKIRESEEK